MKSTLATPEVEHSKVAQPTLIDRSAPSKRPGARDPASKRQRIISVFILASVAASAVQLFVLQLHQNDDHPGLPVRISLEPHDPIFIMSDSGFLGHSAVRNGSGTSSDPYVISDWEINATLAPGIYILQTNAHFVIRNVTVNSTAQDNIGILLESVTNGSVANVTIDNCDMGVVVQTSGSNIVISDSRISNNRNHGIATMYGSSNSINVRNNRIFSNGGTGMALDSCSNFNIVGNNVSTDDPSSGGRRSTTLIGCTNGIVTGNNLTAIYNEALYCVGSNSIYVVANRLSSVYGYGAYLSSCSGFQIYGNNFMGSYFPQAYDDRGPQNAWNASYPTGGNHWSDYTGVDQKSGPGQDTNGPDGIGDTNYTIDSNSFDYYPLVVETPIEPIPEFPTVLLPIVSIAALLFALLRRTPGRKL